MTTNYPVQEERTFAILGHGSNRMTKGFAETVDCLRTHEPEYRR
jgi:hypothetical protein